MSVNMADADCHYGDHFWDGSSQCSNCGARLRCSCGAYVREDNMEAHVGRCAWVARAVEGRDEREEVKR